MGCRMSPVIKRREKETGKIQSIRQCQAGEQGTDSTCWSPSSKLISSFHFPVHFQGHSVLFAVSGQFMPQRTWLLAYLQSGGEGDKQFVTGQSSHGCTFLWDGLLISHFLCESTSCQKAFQIETVSLSIKKTTGQWKAQSRTALREEGKETNKLQK